MRFNITLLLTHTNFVLLRGSRRCCVYLYNNMLKALVLFVTALPLCHASTSSSINNAISVFSTYPSHLLTTQCLTRYAKADCKEDAISPNAFVASLQQTQAFVTVYPFTEQSDYELLIANLGNADDAATMQYAEFTLQWRGIEIDSVIFDDVNVTGRESSVFNDTDNNQYTANKLVGYWLLHADEKKLFSTRFLYSALQASDYDDGLTVPDKVGDFNKLDTQLFADPFDGAITRYTHPTYEDALVDVTVYPFMGALDMETDSLLNEQLDEDLARANATAGKQNLSLSLPSPASRYSVNGHIQGWRLGLKAESKTTLPIYASTYVFKQEDKIVKVATTFPTDISDSLVNELITHVQVPKESTLMKKIRSVLDESAH